MWHTIAEWCGVLALVLALLHFIFPQVGISIGRAILNWKATRSRQNTEKRIEELQAMLARIEHLSTLSDFEDMVIQGLGGIVFLFMLLPTVALLAYSMVFIEPPLALFDFVLRHDLVKTILLLLLLSLIALVTFGIQKSLAKFRRERSLKYRETLRKDIEKLKSDLSKRP